ncbi:uncharacterized protein OCT59_020329 [Rhizophagus irregularis]|uniref:uncharacterized protein n=1 Tax=Rhizophagus irregularis TaxID=588596 RepID=UPI00332D8B85|nr:hypothetical protein OCT59_020329 [Rhizophagus irregularis]
MIAYSCLRGNSKWEQGERQSARIHEFHRANDSYKRLQHYQKRMAPSPYYKIYLLKNQPDKSIAQSKV